jgi:thiamine monophosphate synthase
MSILIKGMKMPTTCDECFLPLRYCPYAMEKDGECPLIEVPPHGRLIDADAFIKEINERIEAAIKWGINAIADRENEIKLRAEQAVATFCEASLTAKKLPTIIEAEVDDG